MDNVSIEIKKDQIEITKTGGKYILLRKLSQDIEGNEYMAQFSDEIVDDDIRRLVGTGVIEIMHHDFDTLLIIRTKRFHSAEMLYLIFADLLKHKISNTNNHEIKKKY